MARKFTLSFLSKKSLFTLAIAFFGLVSVVNAQCTADAGTLAGFKPTDCLQLPGGTFIGGIPNGDDVVPAGFSKAYILSTGAGLTVVDYGTSNLFNVMSINLYNVHTIVYNTGTFSLNSFVTLGTTTVFDINAQFQNGGGSICGDVDLIGTSILVDNPDAGTITADSASFCYINGSATISATPDGNQYLPTGYMTLYVLTQNPGAVIIDLATTPSFTVSATGNYAIHSLVFDPNTFNGGVIQFGVTTAFDVNGLLIQGGGGICAALDMVGAPIDVAPCTGVCTVDAGTVTADSSIYCWAPGGIQVTATPDGNASVPSGYQTLYLLSEGPGLIILDSQIAPSFLVNDSGAYSIHVLVYDPATYNPAAIVFGTTSVYDINPLLIQGGGTICGALSVSGASVKIVTCNGCLADAGTITPDSTQWCQDNSGIWVSATPDGNAVVPPGYQVQYILTSGSNFVIEQFCPSPIFAIHDTGCFTIHTLVFDPNTLNLGAIVFGTSVTADVVGLITQSGGICASVDIVGAQFCVEDCANLCLADAGTLTADSSAVCGSGGNATLSATPDGNDNVPSGFQTIYVLTDAGTGIIQQVNGVPSFSVSTFGNYVIHTLVYDPATLDLSTVMPGVTTGADVNALLSVGSSGAICGDLDIAGALVSYYDCSSGCTAFAGTITPDFTAICYGDSTPATLVATHDGNMAVPNGYQVIYVLTKGPGLVIEAVNGTPDFMVSDSADYYIHTLVYDPSTLDLSTVVFGTTTGFDINALLIQGSGGICASLDVAGAYFDVLHCDALCLADAGSHTAIQTFVCADTVNGVSIGATADLNQVIPPGYLMGYALTYGPNLIVQQASFTPTFTVIDTGWYTIHALVYDPITLNLGVITPGTTAAIDLVGLLIQGGGTICASLDLPGVPIYVDPCLVTSVGAVDASNINVYPNPSSELVQVQLPEGSTSLIRLMDGKGSLLESFNTSVTVHTIDVSDLPVGMYLIEVHTNGAVHQERIQVIR